MSEQDLKLEKQKLELEKQKLDLERQKLELDKSKADLKAPSSDDQKEKKYSAGTWILNIIGGVIAFYVTWKLLVG